MFSSHHEVGTVYAFDKYYSPHHYSNEKEIGKGSFGIVSRGEYKGNDLDFLNQCKSYIDEKGNTHYWFIIKMGSMDESFINEQNTCEQIQKKWREKYPDSTSSCPFNLCVGAFIKTADGEAPIILGQLEGQYLEKVENQYIPHSIDALNFFTQKLQLPIYAAIAIADDLMFTLYESMYGLHNIQWVHGDMALRNALMSEYDGKTFLKLVDYGHAVALDQNGFAKDKYYQKRPVRTVDKKRARFNLLSKQSDLYGYRITRLEEIAISLNLNNYDFVYLTPPATCEVVYTTASPERTQTSFTADAAYIRYASKLYYVTNDGFAELIDITQEELQDFDSIIQVHNLYNAKKELTFEELNQITTIIGHWHDHKTFEGYQQNAFKLSDKVRMDILIDNTKSYLESLHKDHKLKKLQQRRMECYSHYLSSTDLDPYSDFIVFIKSRENFVLKSLKEEIIDFDPKDQFKVQSLNAHLRFFERLENRLKRFDNSQEPLEQALQETIHEILAKYKQVRYLYQSIETSPSVDISPILEELREEIYSLEENYFTPLLVSSDSDAKVWISEKQVTPQSSAEIKPLFISEQELPEEKNYDEIPPDAELKDKNLLRDEGHCSPKSLEDMDYSIIDSGSETEDSFVQQLQCLKNSIENQNSDLKELFECTKQCFDYYSHLKTFNDPEQHELEKVQYGINHNLTRIHLAKELIDKTKLALLNCTNSNCNSEINNYLKTLSLHATKLENQKRSFEICLVDINKLIESNAIKNNVDNVNCFKL